MIFITAINWSFVLFDLFRTRNFPGLLSQRLTSVQNCVNLPLVSLNFSPAVQIYDFSYIHLSCIQFPLPTVLYLLVTHGLILLECSSSYENVDLCNSCHLTAVQSRGCCVVSFSLPSSCWSFSRHMEWQRRRDGLKPDCSLYLNLIAADEPDSSKSTYLEFS